MTSADMLRASMGHILPAFFLLLTGGLLNVIYGRQMKGIRGGVGFADKKQVLGSVLLVGNSIGILVEVCGGIYSFGNPFFQLEHITMYLSFVLPAIGLILESRHEKSSETHYNMFHQIAFGVSFFCQWILLDFHAEMKKEPYEHIAHQYWVFSTKIQLVIIILAILCTLGKLHDDLSMVIHHLIPSSFLVQGGWVFILGFIDLVEVFDSTFYVMPGKVPVFFALLTMSIFCFQATRVYHLNVATRPRFSPLDVEDPEQQAMTEK